jgi:hypothetical protein
MERQIKALYKRFADAALPLGNVYQPQADELYVVLYQGQKATRVRVKIEPAFVELAQQEKPAATA